MANLSSQKLNQYYDLYAGKELAFSKSILQATGLETKKVFLKIKSEHIPCVIYSCSMKAAKIIINLDSTIFEEIKAAKNYVSIRLSFFPKDAKNSVIFFVPSIVKGYNTFNAKSNSSTFLMSLEFSLKPPEDLIEIIGKILELSDNFEKRKSLRFNLEGKVADNLGLASTKNIIVIDNLKRPCIIKNISASGCMIIMTCNPKFILNKKIIMIINVKNNIESLNFEGTIIRSEEITDRKDLYAIGIAFIEDKIPFLYKELLNSYIDKLETMMKKKG
jgi:hypothetical protein